MTDDSLTKADMALLEKAFEAEVRAALDGVPGLLQTKSKRAARLVDLGLLSKETQAVPVPPLGMMIIDGYCLTPLGHMSYCRSCRG